MHKSISDIQDMKQSKEKISVVTAYDYTISSLCDRADIDVLLVGDSAGMVMLGYENTIPVTMEQMCMFTEAACRGRKNAMIVSDLPFMSYQASITDAIANSGRLIQAGADAVKLEGGEEMAETIADIVTAGIPVMGHIGVKPQTAMLNGGYKVQGKTKESALQLVREAQAIEQAGAFSIVLEMVTEQAAQIITETVNIPTIGIGAGAHCDGQVLVTQDMLGMYDKIKPKFVKKYLKLSDEITNAIKNYKNDVKEGTFPMAENSFAMDETEWKKLRDEFGH